MMSNKAFEILGLEESELAIDERHTAAKESYATSHRTSKMGDQLHPQPTMDPLDPLNWNSFKKHSVLVVVMWMYFMFTYITTTTVPSFPELQELFGIDYTQVSLTVAIPSLGLAFGPLLWSSLADIYGRRVIFLAGTSIAFVATIVTALSSTYGPYMVARFFQGLGASPGGTVGMAIINDLFFDYERGQKLGLWVLALNTGLLVGPIFGGLADMASAKWIGWLTAILFGALLILQLLFLPETLYPRGLMLEDMKKARGGEHSGLKRTTILPFINVKPVPGMRHPKLWDSVVRFGILFRYPVVSITVGIYCFAWYWWMLSVITFIPAVYNQYDAYIQGALFIGLLLGSLFAELFCSGRLSDLIVNRLRRRRGGNFVPETRLWLAYPAAILSAGGLILWGISIDGHYHWMIGQIAFFFFAMGLQMGNTVIPSYIIDCYPLQSMSVITFYSVLLDLSALVNPIFIATWIETSGYTNTFIVQGLITFLVVVPVLALVHKFGPDLRAMSGDPSWLNPEFDIL